MLYQPKNAHTSPSSVLLRGPYHLDPLNPDPKAITLDAVAASLDAEIRWLNQTTRRISVAEHQIRCARIAMAYGGTLAQVLACKMHDCGEAVVCDIPGPFKRHVYVQMPDGDFVPYSVIEGRVRAAIVEALILDEQLRDEVLAELADDNGFVHRVDKDAEAIEALRWLPGSEDWALRNVDPRAWMASDVPDTCSWSTWFAWLDQNYRIQLTYPDRTPSAPDRAWSTRVLRRAIGL